MSVTKIYMIRHGESEGNKRLIFLGHTDLDITERGHLQAACTAKYLNDIHADAIYSSDLIRAYNTAKHTAELKGMPIIKEQGLREIYAGLWENKLYEELRVEFKEDRDIWVQSIGLSRCTGGESFAELRERILSTLRRIAENHEGETVFCFTHAAAIRAVSGAIMGLSLADAKNVPWAENASVTELEYENGQFRLLRYGYDDHLKNAGLI